MAKMNMSEAVAAAERERDEARAKLTSELAVRDSREEQAKAAHELELAQAKRASDDLIRYKDEEIERLKDMKVRLSTKMVGESLEQHCETEFNRLRMTAFPNAYFEKITMRPRVPRATLSSASATRAVTRSFRLCSR